MIYAKEEGRAAMSDTRYEYKLDDYHSSFFEMLPSANKKLMDRLQELDVLGWEPISIVGGYNWRIISRRERGRGDGTDSR